MIIPPGFRGAAFGGAADGDGRSDPVARSSIARSLGVGEEWAALRQVHGAEVREADRPGILGEGDALFTFSRGLPLVVATADCIPVVLEGVSGTAIAHAGWRGAIAGVVAAARAALESRGEAVVRAAIGPGIGPCCFEVGGDVAARFPERHRSRTRWGTVSVDLVAAVKDQLHDVHVWESGACTMCDDGFNSFRRDGTRHRQIGLAWLPSA